MVRREGREGESQAPRGREVEESCRPQSVSKWESIGSGDNAKRQQNSPSEVPFNAEYELSRLQPVAW